jgi:hypothetical protein
MVRSQLRLAFVRSMNSRSFAALRPRLLLRKRQTNPGVSCGPLTSLLA